jgi:hypothetical protein
MNWEQKLIALQAIADVSLQMRCPGNWYVSSSMYIGGDGMLVGEFGNGHDPQSAVHDHWDKFVTRLTSDCHIYSRGKRVRWNGFMWQEVSI